MWVELTGLGTSDFPLEALSGMLNYSVSAGPIGLIIAGTATAVGIEKAVDILIDTIR